MHIIRDLHISIDPRNRLDEYVRKNHTWESYEKKIYFESIQNNNIGRIFKSYEFHVISLVNIEHTVQDA